MELNGRRDVSVDAGGRFWSFFNWRGFIYSRKITEPPASSGEDKNVSSRIWQFGGNQMLPGGDVRISRLCFPDYREEALSDCFRQSMCEQQEA